MPDSKIFSWEMSTTNEYLQLFSDTGVQHDELVTKCDRVITALLRRSQKIRATIEASIDRVTAWKRQWQKQEGKGKEYNLAQSMEDISGHKNPQQLWDDFHQHASSVQDSELKLCTAAADAVLLYQSVQRPSAIMGFTMDEFAIMTYMPDERVLVPLVAEHKTGRQGPALLTVSSKQKSNLDAYIEKPVTLWTTTTNFSPFQRVDRSPMYQSSWIYQFLKPPS